MQKRGQASLLYALIAILVLGAILLLFPTTKNLSNKGRDAETSSFLATMQVKLLQQSIQTKGSQSNTTLHVPSHISEVCFFESDQPSEPLRNIELSSLFSQDSEHTLFLRTGHEYFPLSLDKFHLDKEDNPLCVAVADQSITLSLTSTGTESRIQASTSEPKCKTVMQNALPEEAIDIVFIGSGYSDPLDFSQDTGRFGANILLSFAPFSSRRNKFNVYQTSAQISCQTSDYLTCDPYQAQLIASDCPVDYVVVLVDRSLVADFIRPVRSSTANDLMKINTADRPYVIVHEFGHLFGLADEYVDETYYRGRFDPLVYPNCDSAPCTSWASVDGAGCYQGCSLSDSFRPTENSIMRDLASPTFGPVSEREILRRLGAYD